MGEQFGKCDRCQQVMYAGHECRAMTNTSDTPRAEIARFKLHASFCNWPEEAIEAMDRYDDLVQDLERSLALLSARNAELEEALRKHGQHDPDCSAWDKMDSGKLFDRHSYPCDCGFRAALAAEQTAHSKEDGE